MHNESNEGWSTLAETRCTRICAKVWRFDVSALDAYSRGRVEEEVLVLFPALQSKGLRLELSYEDSHVGRISIDGVADVHTALATLVEENYLSFRMLFVEECVKPEGEVLYSAEKRTA